MSAPMTATSTQDLLPTRYSLLSRLQDWDDQDSWKDFFDTYWRLIYSIALKSGLTEAEAQDVVQETVISVAKNIHTFKRDRALGSFKGWLRNITRWRIADQLRLRGRPMAEDKIISLDSAVATDICEIPGPAGEAFEAAWEADWRANMFAAALERVKRRVREEHYQIFDLNVIRHWPASKVAQTLNINIAQVYLAKHRIMSLIKKEIRTLEERR
jgi:RNA polymerase sigma-70 factor (ECF subfamily)